MDELKPCPFCGQKAERSPINGSVCCPVRGIGKHTDYLRPDAWQTRPIEDALQRRVEELEERVNKYQIIMREDVDRVGGIANFHNFVVAMNDMRKLRTAVNEAVRKIENKMSEWDGYERTGYMMWDALDILRKHGVVEDK